MTGGLNNVVESSTSLEKVTLMTRVLSLFLAAAFCAAIPAYAGEWHTEIIVDQVYSCPKTAGSWGDGTIDAELQNTSGQDRYIIGLITATEQGPVGGIPYDFTSYLKVYILGAGGAKQYLEWQGGKRGNNVDFGGHYFRWPAWSFVKVAIWCNGSAPWGPPYAFVAVRYALTPP